MRRILAALVVMVALTACGSPSPPRPGPLFNVRAFVYRAQVQPAPTATPLPSDRICLDGLAEHGGALPDAVVKHLTGVEPAVLESDLFDLLDDAMDEVGIGGGNLAVTAETARSGETMLAISWCEPYGDTDIFVRDAAGEVWHVIHTRTVSTDGASVHAHTMWLDGVWLVSQRLPGIVERLHVWIVEPEGDGWAVSYEADHRDVISTGTFSAPELDRYTEGGVDYLRLQYLRDDGTRVNRVYELQRNRYVLVEDERAEEGE